VEAMPPLVCWDPLLELNLNPMPIKSASNEIYT
jgi:hypothetical protein